MKNAGLALLALAATAIALILFSQNLSNNLSGAASGNVSLEVLPAPAAAVVAQAPLNGPGGFEGKLTGTPPKKPITLSIFVLNPEKKAVAGGNADVSISILGASGEVKLSYGLSKIGGTIKSDEETITTQGGINIVRKISLPDYLKDGPYSAFASAIIDGQSYDASDDFTITSVPAGPTAQFAFAAPSPLIAAILMVGFAIGALAVLLYKHIKHDRAVLDYIKDYYEYYFKKPEK